MFRPIAERTSLFVDIEGAKKPVSRYATRAMMTWDDVVRHRLSTSFRTRRPSRTIRCTTAPKFRRQFARKCHLMGSPKFSNASASGWAWTR
ncbi:MAG: hypothetical protein ACE5NJ_03570 [Thermodesulfobacteriota bacterium]